MVRPLSLAQHTLYADLLEQGIDDLFDPEMSENGSILVRPNRAGAPADHAYYQGYHPAAGSNGRGQRYARYLGRADDPDVAARIARFQRVKAVRSERITTVRALIGAGLPRPNRITGRIIEALARAGLFPDDAVLLGDAAYQTYGGILGVHLAKPQRITTIDCPAVEIVVRNGHRTAEILTALRAVDPSFAAELETTVAYRSATGVRVAVTMVDGAADASSDLIRFLTADPVQSVILHGPGIPATVPAPERFAVHALIARGVQIAEAPALARAQADPGLADEVIAVLTCIGRRHAVAGAFVEARGLSLRLPTDQR